MVWKNLFLKTQKYIKTSFNVGNYNYGTLILEERFFNSRNKFKKCENFNVITHKLRVHFDVNNGPSLPAMETLINKFERKFSLKYE